MSDTPLTIYCSGTNYDWTNEGELVAELFKATKSPAWIVAGPGSKKRSGGFLSRMIGLLDGEWHMDGAVKAVVAKLREAPGRPSHLNLAGWSRGAISCNAIAFRLRNTPGWESMPINIFAIDPVPGPTNFEQKYLRIDANVRDYTAVYMQNELRSIMTPGEPRFSSSSTRYRYLNFPGRHSTGVEPKKGFEEVFEVVRHLAEEFVVVRGTELNPEHRLSRVELVERYAQMVLKTRQYFENANRFVGSKWAMRSVKGLGTRNTLENHLSQGNGYFVNSHHRHEFSQLFPLVHDYYFTNAVIRLPVADRQRHFLHRADAGRRGLLAGLRRMNDRCVLTYTSLGLYQEIMDGLSGTAKKKAAPSLGREAMSVDPITVLESAQ
ncbi:MAG: hypothetical protein NXI31_27125 [bacterium]|nr:hypothetical protein [bacterium]